MDAKSFRYNTKNNWYKGNTHIHTIASDGGKTVNEIADLYESGGYHFIFYTDHWVASDIKDEQKGRNILLLNGIELDGRDESDDYFHVVCLGTIKGVNKDTKFEAAMKAARKQGAVLILAHPHWCANTFEEAKAHDFDGVEIYNNICRFLNGKGDGSVYWNVMLRNKPKTLGFASDDAHLRPGEHQGWNKGWIVVNSPDLSREAVMTSIKSGNFYSSQGPEFKAIEFDGKYINITTSPVKFMRMAGPASLGVPSFAPEGEFLTKMTFELREKWKYAYIEIEDENGKCAWSNALFV